MRDGMRVRRNAIVLLLVAGVNALGGIAWALLLDRTWPFWVGACVAAACGLGIILLRCPKCGESLAKRRASILGVAWTYWGWFVPPKHCSWCRYSFVETGTLEKETDEQRQ